MLETEYVLILVEGPLVQLQHTQMTLDPILVVKLFVVHLNFLFSLLKIGRVRD